MLQVYRYAMAHNQSFKFIYTLMSIFSAASQLIEKDKINAQLINQSTPWVVYDVPCFSSC